VESRKFQVIPIPDPHPRDAPRSGGPPVIRTLAGDPKAGPRRKEWVDGRERWVGKETTQQRRIRRVRSRARKAWLEGKTRRGQPKDGTQAPAPSVAEALNAPRSGGRGGRTTRRSGRAARERAPRRETNQAEEKPAPGQEKETPAGGEEPARERPMEIEENSARVPRSHREALDEEED
jgi:hypothetical protein